MIASLKGNIIVQKAFHEIKNNVNLEIIYLRLLHLQIEVHYNDFYSSFLKIQKMSGLQPGLEHPQEFSL